MSIFQGREQAVAWDALVAHEPDGIQLTPGNLPSAGFRKTVERSSVPVRLHHGFAWERYKRPVYDADARPIRVGRHHSVHPPRTHPTPRRTSTRPKLPGRTVSARAWLTVAAEHGLLVETMYPGYALGCGDELELAIDMRLRLAVDVSHLEIQRHHGVLRDATYRRVLNYEGVEEIHVSASRGRSDAHRPLTRDTPGLGWARDRIRDLPVVLESYWHRLSVSEQREQLALLA